MSELKTISQLKEMQEKALRDKLTEEDYRSIMETFPDIKPRKEELSSTEVAKEKKLLNPNIPSLLEKKAGFSNVIYLATIALVSEICFIAIAFLIFK